MDTKAKWNKIIESKLKENQSLKDLNTEYDSGIIMEPNIVADEVAHLNHKINSNKPWINMATIHGATATSINSLALQALNHGANGLNIVSDSHISISDALDSVLTEYLDVRIDCSSWSEEEASAEVSKLDSSKYPNLRWIGSGKVKALEVSTTDRVTQLKSVIKQIGDYEAVDIIITLSKNLLFEIASLRALRLLLEEQGHTNYNILARFDIEGTNELGDYNLIEKTYKTLSGILGCADAILTPYLGDEDSRLTLNIHNVLDLESGFKDVIDPVGGAYYIEKLVSEIIEKVKN